MSKHLLTICTGSTAPEAITTLSNIKHAMVQAMLLQINHTGTIDATASTYQAWQSIYLEAHFQQQALINAAPPQAAQ